MTAIMPDDGLTQTGFAIDGMFCGGCAATVERALARIPGVEAASVSFVSDAALVRHNADRVSRATLASVIAKLGYSARSLADNDDEAGSAARNAFLRNHQIRLAVAICFGMWSMFASAAGYLGQIPTPELEWAVAVASGLLALPVLLYSGLAFYRLGWRSLRVGAPGMEALITLAVAAAAAVSITNLMRGSAHVYFDAAVMLITFQLIARITDFNVRRSAGDAARRLLTLAPERARRIGADGSETVHPRELAVGDQIEVRPGERLPADGRVTSGESQLDASLITGEAVPHTTRPGDTVLAGMLVLDGVLRIAVSAVSGAREIDILATEVRRLITGKTALARLADVVARWLLPVIVIAALLACLLAVVTGAGWQMGITRALAVVIVTCPCALSLAVPMAITAATSAAARRGIVLRDPGLLESATRIDTVLFDKTGTLTEGKLSILAVHCVPGVARGEVLAAASRAEYGSTHPIGKAIRAAVTKAGDETFEVPPKFRELAGRGVETTDRRGQVWRVGSSRWFRELGLVPMEADVPVSASRVQVAIGQSVLGVIELADALRPEAHAIIGHLQKRGYRLLLASGDSAGPVASVANALGIESHHGLRPNDKLQLIRELQTQGCGVAFVGDGLNDGPALAAADLGIAVGSASDLAKSAAAVGLLREGLVPVVSALILTRQAGRVLKQNLIWALAYNALVLPAAIAGYVYPLFAAVAMAASSISVSLNAVRAGWVRTDAPPVSHARGDTPDTGQQLNTSTTAKSR